MNCITMATRQTRLNTLQQIQQKLPSYTGKKINIVLHDRTVFFGRLKGMNDSTLEIVNMRKETISVDLNNISEVYLDFVEQC